MTVTESIQAVLDAGGVATLPPWDVTIDRPLVLRRPDSQLRGDPSGRTRLFGDFGSGPLVLAQPSRPFSFSAYQPRLLLASEPSLYYPAPQTLHVAYPITRKSVTDPNNAAVHVHCGCDYGVISHTAWGIWDYFGNLRLWWDGTPHDAPGVAQAAGRTYQIDLTYDGTTVTLTVDGAVAVSFPFSGPVPQWPMGVDVIAVGYDAAGPHGILVSHGPPDATFGPLTINGFHLDLAANDGTFLLGTRADGKAAFVLPASVETQGGGFVVSDITFMGSHGASGVSLYDTIFSRLERVSFVGSWHGLVTRGSTYAGNFSRIGGTCLSVAWLQVGQSMATCAADLNLSAAGISMLVAGSAGGSYTKVYVAPLGGSLLSIYVRESHDVNVFGGQVDDEGQAGPVRGVVVSDAATVKLYGVQVVRQTPGPVLSCVRGGTVHAHGSWLSTAPGSAELVHFADRPDETTTILACRFDPAGVPTTLTPDNCLFLRDGVLCTPSISTPAV